jgi:hypothetical protein
MSKLREELHQLIDEFEDDKLLKHIFEILKSAKPIHEIDFWDELSEEEKERVERSLELSKDPANWIPNDQVMEKAAKWKKSK